MSNNARAALIQSRKGSGGSDGEDAQIQVVGCEYGEMGSAQYFQAMAAGVTPTVDMNPILMKPDGSGCQVVVLGRVSTATEGLKWSDWNAVLWPHAQAALRRLLTCGYDRLVIEGMGSPAEANLNDMANLRTGREAEANYVIVTDIDRGGAFAHLLGTFLMMTPLDRERVRGFVINKFSGDPIILAPAIEDLRQRTGVPTIAVLPILDASAMPPEEDLFRRHDDNNNGGPKCGTSATATTVVTVVVVKYPYASNTDEFAALRRCDGVRLSWTTDADVVSSAALEDVVVLPGSKNTTRDLSWMRERGVADALQRRARAGGRIMGICGGLQMLGHRLGVEDRSFRQHHDNEETLAGLGLLPVVTTFATGVPKLVRHVPIAVLRMPPAGGRRVDQQLTPSWCWWACLDGMDVDGYEIHSGATRYRDEDGDHEGWCYVDGPVFGTYLHGLFENANFRLRTLRSPDADRKPGSNDDDDDVREVMVEPDFPVILADLVDRYFITELDRRIVCS